MYSYDVASPSRPSASRSIPSMRPSYDAEHPSPATPIYDALYSEYRRLFRALPGDRSDEESMRFTGFAVREPASVRHELMPYPQHQSFHTFAGQAGTPQFMPSQQSAAHQYGRGGGPGQTHGHSPSHNPGGNSSHTSGHNNSHTTGNSANEGTSALGQGHAATAGQYATTGPASGQGWVAAGYLAPSESSFATAPGSAAGAGAPGAGGRHRSMLSLPPGRGPAQS
ncbi:hypothetical protein [Kitasatospora sp. NPDC088346]|uniref:hypothetical protein n=1 Tax=Kitasatospora sp. NPDC088346 TaxID=3364073 RepID=UPI00380305D5